MAKATGLSLRQMQALEATARLGSFSDAARELGVSQPTVSNLVVAAETHFGCKLLVREGNKVSPAAMYETVRGRVIALLALSREVDGTLGAYRDLEDAQLRLGYTTYQITMPLVARFAEAHPGTDLTARALASHDLLPMLHSGELDIGFVTARECPADCAGHLVQPTRVGLVVPREHPFAATEGVEWEALEGQRLLQREPSSGTRRIFEAAARVAGARITTVLGLGSWGSIAMLVQSGTGLGVALEVECARESDLVFVPVQDRNLIANHYLVALPAMLSVAPVRAFFDSVKQHGPSANS